MVKLHNAVTKASLSVSREAAEATPMESMKPFKHRFITSMSSKERNITAKTLNIGAHASLNIGATYSALLPLTLMNVEEFLASEVDEKLLGD